MFHEAKNDEAGELELAIEANAPDRVIRALYSGWDARGLCRRNGEPFIIDAISRGAVEVTCHLLDRGADPNTRSPITGKSCLRIAVETSNESMVCLLLGLPQRLRARQRFMLQSFVRRGWLKATRLLLTVYRFDANEPSVAKIGPQRVRTYRTALSIAVDNGDANMVEMLLAHGARPNLRYTNPFLSDNSALHLACRRSSLRIVRLLIKYGASVNARAANGSTFYTPLCEALDNHKDEIAYVLIRAGALGELGIHRGARFTPPLLMAIENKCWRARNLLLLNSPGCVELISVLEEIYLVLFKWNFLMRMAEPEYDLVYAVLTAKARLWHQEFAWCERTVFYRDLTLLDLLTKPPLDIYRLIGRAEVEELRDAVDRCIEGGEHCSERLIKSRLEGVEAMEGNLEDAKDTMAMLCPYLPDLVFHNIFKYFNDKDVHVLSNMRESLITLAEDV